MSKTKKLLSLLLAAIMCLSLIPAMAFAEEDPLTYVALGDSMSQGYMFTDYNEDHDGHYCGWQGSSERGYIKEFAEVLRADAGAVNLIDLTIQGLQPDEVYAFLKPAKFDFDSMTRGARKHIGWWTKEYVTDEEQDPNTYLFETFAAMSDYYIDSIKKADVITYDLGMNYFGTYLTDMRGEDEVFTTLLTDSRYTKQLESFRKQLAAYLKDNGMEAIGDRLNGILYAYVSYLYYTDKCMDAIYDLNPDVQLILIPLSNPHRDLYVDLGGYKVSYSGIIDLMMESLNSYMRTTDKNRDRYTIAKLDGPVISFADELYYYPDDLSEDVELLLGQAVMGYNSILGMNNYPAFPTFTSLYEGAVQSGDPEAIMYFQFLLYFAVDDSGEVLKDEDGNYLMSWNVLDRLIYDYISEKYGEDVAYNDFFGNYIDLVLGAPSVISTSSVTGDNIQYLGYPDININPAMIERARAAIAAGTAEDWQNHIVEAADFYVGDWEGLCLKAAKCRTFPVEFLTGDFDMTGFTSEDVIRLLNDPDSATEEELVMLHAGIRQGQAARGFGAHPCPRGLQVKYDAVMKVYQNGLRAKLPGMKNDLTIHYVCADGSQAAPDYSGEVVIGQKYSVDSPEVEGFVADKTKVSGTMGEKAVELTVTYTAPITEGCVDETEVVPPTAGEHHLYLNGKDMGVFTFAKSGNKWSIQNAEGKFLTVQNGKLALSNSADACWTYQNEAFTVSVQTTTRSNNSFGIFGWLFGGFGRSTTKTTTYYLTASNNALSVSTSAATAAVYDVTPVGNHTKGESVQENVKAATCKERGGYDEVYYCEHCGKELSRSHVVTELSDQHTPGKAKTEKIGGVNYQVTRCTVCGEILEKTEAPAGEVTANVTVTSNTTRFLIFFTRTSYNVKINASTSVPGVSIAKVQYSTNGYNWSTGTGFSSSSKPGTVYVRVTDSVGTVVNFTYSNGTTVKD